MKRLFYLIFVTVLLLSSCKAKKYRKLAAEFEKSGAFDQAAEYYYKSLLRNSKEVEAVVGFQKNAQIVLDNKYQDFVSSFKNGDYKNAVYIYNDAVNYKDKAKNVNVNLLQIRDYDVYYSEAKDEYLSDVYVKANNFLTNENYSSAKALYSEILNFDKQFKDTNEKFVIATYEPKYRKAVDLLNVKDYRAAYYKFSDILRYKDYKDSNELKDEAQQKATIKIAVYNIRGYINSNETYEELKRYVVSHLDDIPSPFYKIVELTPNFRYITTDNMLRYAKENGAKAVFFIDIDKLDFDYGRLKNKHVGCYKKKESEYEDSEGNKKTRITYHKTHYNLYTNHKTIQAKLNYKIVSTLDKSILVNEYVNKTIDDAIEYATYDGDQTKLVGGRWKYKNEDSDYDKVQDNSSENRKIKNLLTSNRNLKSDSELKREMLKIVTDRVLNSIANYDPK
jgi:tetratricopeptide (TPR) repeat protein